MKRDLFSIILIVSLIILCAAPIVWAQTAGNACSGYATGQAITVGTNSANPTQTLICNSSGNWVLAEQIGSNTEIGIATTSPQAQLDINGGLRIGSDSNPCNASHAGEIYYSGSSGTSPNKLLYCNGSVWNLVTTTAAPASSSCGSPSSGTFTLAAIAQGPAGTASQSVQTVTGYGTSWSSALVGDALYYSDSGMSGISGVISAFNNGPPQTLTVGENVGTISQQGYAIYTSPVALGLASQSGTTVTGYGTSWSSALIGDTLVYLGDDDALSGVISAFNNGPPQTLTVGSSMSIIIQEPYNIYGPPTVGVGSASQSGTTVTGTNSPGWTSAMVGDVLVFTGANNGTSMGIITKVSSSTSLTVTVSQTISTKQSYELYALDTTVPGNALASQSGKTVTGYGTNWTSAMIGGQLIFGGFISTGIITAVPSSTSLTVETSQALATQSFTPYSLTDGSMLASQSGTTVTGYGTSWTSSMIGNEIIYAGGAVTGIITAVASATSLTASISQTVSAQAFSIYAPSETLSVPANCSVTFDAWGGGGGGGTYSTTYSTNGSSGGGGGAASITIPAGSSATYYLVVGGGGQGSGSINYAPGGVSQGNFTGGEGSETVTGGGGGTTLVCTSSSCTTIEIAAGGGGGGAGGGNGNSNITGVAGGANTANQSTTSPVTEGVKGGGSNGGGGGGYPTGGNGPYGGSCYAASGNGVFAGSGTTPGNAGSLSSLGLGSAGWGGAAGTSSANGVSGNAGAIYYSIY